MSVELILREINGVSIVSVSGKLTLGEGVGVLRHRLATLVKHGHTNIVLDLAGLTQLDSSGIGVLVASFATITNQGGRLKLLNATARVKDLLLLTKLCTVFELFESESAALASFEYPVAQHSAMRG